jgi:hypothetical protein
MARRRGHLDASSAFRAAAVPNVNEHALAHVAMRGDASRHGDLAAFGVIRAGGVAGFRRCEFIFEGVNAFRAQGGEFGLALLDQ